MVDVGTNAEIVLGNKQKMLAASSPTGPAFEGAQLSSGQRAAPGAIERVRIDRNTYEPKFRVVGCELWSDEPGFAAATADTGITGICGSGIIEVIAEMFLSGIIKSDGIISGDLAEKTWRVQADKKTWKYVLVDKSAATNNDKDNIHPMKNDAINIMITQQDVRAIQLAKAALYAGAKLLMDKFGIIRPDRIRLAGAFGAHIDVGYAMTLGMIPDCKLDKVTSAGNAAGAGAIIALLDKTARLEIEDVVQRIEKVETAVEPKFQTHFVEALAIPHKTEKCDNLKIAVDFSYIATPENNITELAGARRGRRRRIS